jgi:putative spermidine/putrescine transport system ATP-binding protein/putrescine transport system ATP-binding protein
MMTSGKKNLLLGSRPEFETGRRRCILYLILSANQTHGPQFKIVELTAATRTLEQHMNPVVEVRGLSKTFDLAGAQKASDAHRAVSDMSFEVENKQCLCLLGPSGCGKTTTLRMIAGLERPDEGAIFIQGADVTRLPPYLRDVGLVFQDYALFPHMTVAENIAFGLHHRGAPKSEIPDRIQAVLSLVQLPGYDRRKPAQLSGGEQQRVALARALVTRPAVLLLDEPLSNLDAKLRADLRVQIREILSAAQTTTILVTHDQDEAMGLADRIIVMRKGVVEQAGAPVEIYDRPRTRFVAEFIGRSNWLKGEIVAPAANGLGRFRLDSGEELLVPLPEDGAGGKFDLCIRPERILVAPARTPESDASDQTHNHLNGKVRHGEALGAQFHLHVTLSNGDRMLAIIPRTAAMDFKGATVELAFRPRDALLVPRSTA